MQSKLASAMKSKLEKDPSFNKLDFTTKSESDNPSTFKTEVPQMQLDIKSEEGEVENV